VRSRTRAAAADGLRNIAFQLGDAESLPPDHETQNRFNELERLRDPSHTRALTRDQLRATLADIGAEIAATASRENILDCERWLEQTATSPDAAAEIRSAWRAELSGGPSTGMRPTRTTGDAITTFSHTWELVVAAPATQP
jgi:hypothetical protein